MGVLLVSVDHHLNAQASITYGRSFDLTDGVTYMKSFNSLTEENDPKGIVFNGDGTKIFVVGNTNDAIYSYTLTTPYDLSGGVTYDGDGSKLSVSTQETSPTGIAFSSNGLKLFIVGDDGDEVNQYSLSTAYDITSTVTHQGVYDISGQTIVPYDIAFSNDGSRMFIVGTNVYQYTLTSAFDITGGAFTVTYNGSYTTLESSVAGVDFSSDGKKMFVVGSANDKIYQYSLSTAFTITSGVTYDSQEYSVTNQESFPSAVVFNSSGTKFFVAGFANGLSQYNVFDGGFTENDANNGFVDGAIHISLTGDTFTHTGSTMSHGVDYTITNLPTGLTPTLSISASGNTADLLLSGYATAHQVANNVASLQFTFANSAFTGGSAAGVTNAVAASSGLGITYSNNYPQLYYGGVFDLSNSATFDGASTAMTAQEANPAGLAFSSNGQKMFIVGSSSDKVHQYSLSTPFKVTSGFSYDGTPFSVVGQEGNSSGLAFSKDGLSMFIIGGSKYIYQYSLNAPFNITSGANYVGSYYVGSYEGYPSGITFNNNGKKLFIVGSTGDEVNQFSLSTPYSVTSGVVHDGLFSINAQETDASGIAFSYDGKKMFISGASGKDVTQYSLSFPFDVTSGGVAVDGTPLSVNTEETLPSDLAFSADGSKLFVIGFNGDDANTYQLPVGTFTETSSNDGGVQGSVTIKISDDKFTNSGSNLIAGTHYSISNLPSGLSSSIAVAADGLSASLTLSGTAAVHQSLDNISSLTFTFTNSAFVGGSANNVEGAVAKSSGVGISYDNNVEITFGNAFGLNDGARYQGDFKLFAASTDEAPQGITFSADGTKMFMVGLSDKEINQIHLTTPFRPELGYGLGVGPFSVSTQDTSPRDVAFSTDGLKMFVLGATNKRIYEYSLTTPFSLASGVTYSNSFFGVSGLDSSPTSMTFSPDGSKIFLSGSTNDRIYQINLSIPFSISSASSSGNFYGVATQETNPVGVRMNQDGTRMFVFGTSSDKVHQYTLLNPFDLSSGVSYANVSLDISAQSSNAYSFTFSGDGQRIIISDYQKLHIYALTKDGFKESPANDGGMNGQLVLNLHHDTFVNTGSTLTAGTHYTLSSTPVGLTPVMTVSGDGHSATLTYTGAATNHQNTNDVAELSITFTDAAFANSDAADVLNSVAAATGYGIDFRDNTPAIYYGSRLDLDEGYPSFSTTYSTTSQDNSSLGMSFSNDGLRLFVVGAENDAVYQYNLTSAFDISSGVSYSGLSFDVSNEESVPTDVDFNKDGTKMYVSGTSDNVNQYSLSTPFSLSGTVTLDGIFPPGNDASPSGITFSQDGLKLYMIGSQSDKIFQYSLSSPFDLVDDVTYDGTSYAVTNYNYTDIDISEDGLHLFVTNSSYPGSTQVRQFNLAEPFDIAAGVTGGNSFVFFDFTPHAQDIHYSPDGKKLFMLGADGTVFEFMLPYDGFTETQKNDGVVDGELYIAIQDEKFTHPGSQLTHGSDYTISNLPSGLTPSLTVAADSYSATLTFSGKAASHQNDDDVELQFTFTNSAFAGGNASAVQNAMAASSKRLVDFRDNKPAISYGNVLDMNHATPVGSPFDVSGQDSYPYGLAFSSNGLKMFVLGNGNATVYQYILTTPYDIQSGVTYSQAFDLSAVVSDANDLAFSVDGLKMFVLDNDNYEVFQYNLTTSFDITSGVTYSGHSFDFESYDTSVYGFTFSVDGTKMLIAGTNDYEIFQFTLGSAFDLSTAPTYDGHPLVTENVASPTGLAFSQDGRYLIMTEDDNDYEVVRYVLNTAFDITAGATFDGTYFSLGDYSAWGAAIAVKPDGSRVFVADGDNALIYQFNIDLGGFTETEANDGAVDGEMNIFVVDDKFSSAGSSLTYGTDYTITNLPSGLVADFAVAADGYSAALTFTGKASVHQDATDILSLIFTFNNSAFVSSSAADVANAVSASSGIGIDFLINTENDILTFVLAQQTGAATIDDVNHTVTMEVAAGTSLTSLAPTITLSDGASSDPASGMSQNFTTAVTYTVTSEDGTDQDWEVTVTEQQVAPTDLALSSSTIDENNSAGAAVGTFSTTDANTSQTHLYTLVSGTGSTDNGSFSIVGAELRAGVAFDYEAKHEYKIRVKTNDQNGGLFEKAFVITINDVNEMPTDIALDNTTVDESNPAGTLVGTLSTTDEDNGQSHLYSLVSGSGDEGNSAFAIDGNQLKTAVTLDFETQDTYSVRIETDDQNGGTREEVFTISVNDLPAQVTSLKLDNQSVMENLETGALVGNLTTLGEDLSGSYTYTLVPGTGDTNNPLFNISGSQLVTNSIFDFELANSYSVRIKTDDGNGNTLEKAFTISVGDEPESSDANILTFALAEQAGVAVINNTDHTVAIDVVFGTDVTTLTPEITISAEATVNPASGAAQDFTNPVVYTVTAEEGNTQEWTVTVAIAPNSATDILTFVLVEQTGDAVIDAENHSVSVTVVTGTDATALTPTITVSEQATISPASGATQDFSAPVSYTVTAGNGATQEWTVTVTVEPAPLSSASDILTFSLPEEAGPAVIDASGHTVAIEVVAGTNITSLNPAITISAAASISPASGAPQDFTSAVVYTVTAEDGSTQGWTATVTVAPATEPLSSAKDIIGFLLHEQTGDALINTTDHTVTVEVEAGTDVSNLSPAITVSDKASVSPGSEVAQDFSSAVLYIVTAEDGSTQEWTATVTVKEGTKTGIAEAFANVTVYPNPATDQIKVAGLSKGSSLQLVTLNGAIINQVSSSIYEVESISLTGLTGGVYVLQVSTEGKIKSYRIIKE